MTVSLRSRAFTLIELLVVIAVIAILAAILFPVFAAACEKARQSRCLSQMRQATHGILMYTQDHNEMLPLGSYNTNRSIPFVVTWQDLVEPYVKVGAGGVLRAGAPAARREVGFWTCPSIDNKSFPTAPGDPLPNLPPVRYTPALSYINNANIMPTIHSAAFALGFFPAPPTPLARLESVARVVMVAEGLGYVGQTGGDDWFSGCYGLETGFPDIGNPALGRAENYCAARYRHNGGALYALADGHVKWYRGPEGSYRARSQQGAAWRKSLTPNAQVWFRED
jgi:prepilin-type N-terminal cleavage/methylation domain-containing protein/prepilin-type processing-associated H-X9-DG protein